MTASGDAGGLAAGAVLAGRYRIERPLGAGGMGAVYVAEQLAVGRKVALKVLQPDLAADGSALARFRREMQATASVEHPNTVNLYDFGATDDGRLFIAMELVDGRSLHEVLRAGGAMATPRLLRIGAQIARGLAAAHAEGIVHRDLKPENVMLVDRYGERDVVKVLDFGIARFVEHAREERGEPTLTRAGAVIGTPRYMSPEQATGAKVDERSDLYALGVLIYEMVTGVVPFRDPTPLRVLMMHAHEAPPSPSDVAAQPVPAALEALILSLLAKAPSERPSTATQVADRLEAMRAALSEAATRPEHEKASVTVGERPGAKVAAETGPITDEPTMLAEEVAAAVALGAGPDSVARGQPEETADTVLADAVQAASPPAAKPEPGAADTPPARGGVPAVVWVGGALSLFAAVAIGAALMGGGDPPARPQAEAVAAAPPSAPARGNAEPPPAPPSAAAVPAADAACEPLADPAREPLERVVRGTAKGAPLLTVRGAIDGLPEPLGSRAEVVALRVFVALLEADPSEPPQAALKSQAAALRTACPRSAAAALAQAWLLSTGDAAKSSDADAAAALAAGLPGFRPDLAMNLALTAFQAKRFELAGLTARAVVAHRPDDLDARFVVGHAALFGGDAEAAATAFRAIVHKDGTRAPVWWALSEARAAAGDAAGAREAACAAQKHGFDAPEAAERCKKAP